MSPLLCLFWLHACPPLSVLWRPAAKKNWVFADARRLRRRKTYGFCVSNFSNQASCRKRNGEKIESHYDFLTRGRKGNKGEQGGAGQTHLISGFAGPLSAVMIRQNQPFVCWLRHLALFAAHVLEYTPRKKCHFPCRHAKILFFRILPVPTIRLRFAPAEQRWLRLFLFVSQSIGE